MTIDEVLNETASRLRGAYLGIHDPDDARANWLRSVDQRAWRSVAREAWRIAAYNRTMAFATQARGEAPPELALPPDGWGGVKS